MLIRFSHPEPEAEAELAVAYKRWSCKPPPSPEKSFDEFHLYTLERPTTLHDEETKQVEFVRATDICAQRLYVYDGADTGALDTNPEQIRHAIMARLPIPKFG